MNRLVAGSAHLPPKESSMGRKGRDAIRRPLVEPLEPRLLLDATTDYGGLFFYGRQDIAVGNAPCGIVSGDFNADGRADLAVANYQDHDLSILYGQAGGSLGGRPGDER